MTRHIVRRYNEYSTGIYCKFKYTTGTLAGFYAATTLTGNTAITTYTSESVHLAAIIETQAGIPIPPERWQAIGGDLAVYEELFAVTDDKAPE